MRTLTQRAAMIFGVVFLLVGLLGLFLDGGMGMESHPDRAPHLLGLFPVNLLHNLVHMAFGVWGLLAARTLSAAKGYHKGAAAIYVVLAILGFVAPTGFGLVPIGGNDIWLHAVLAAGLGYFGFMHREAGVHV
ncbi:MAG: DUF4383 domain-containing protein [Gemmatimonadetes bacterium]|nr:DUF4383 domain-containing protein [Gemmatimonadota bacterium]